MSGNVTGKTGRLELTPGGRQESFTRMWDASAPITWRLGILRGPACLHVASLCGLASSHPRHLKEADTIQGSSGFHAWVFQWARWKLHVFLWPRLKVTWHHFCQISLVEIRIHFLTVKLQGHIAENLLWNGRHVSDHLENSRSPFLPLTSLESQNSWKEGWRR